MKASGKSMKGMTPLKIEIYSKLNCQSCAHAKKVLDQLNIPFYDYEIGRHVSVDNVKKLFPDARTVPIIVVDGSVVAGVDDVLSLMSRTDEIPMENNS